MSDVELNYDSEHEVSENHSKLIEAVSKLDKGQRVKKPQRSEPSLQVSEFHLVKSGISDNDAVYINDLAKTLGSKGHHAEISKKIKATQSKSKVLSKPLEKPAAEKLKRIVGFENTKKELKQWNAIVSKNRTAEMLSFPLRKNSKNEVKRDNFISRYRLRSELEKALDELEPEKKVEEEKVDEFPLTLEEIIQKRKEAAKIRAQQSYKHSKSVRQSKIKSKKFHKIQKKEKMKQTLKEFEELQKTDPAAALEKLAELDRVRAQERMSLRHKSTGQWAKNKLIRAKYDKETRKELAQQLSISKALTQKTRSNVDSDADDVDDEIRTDQVLKVSASDKDNPWVNTVKTSSEIDDFISGYRKYWEEKNKSLKENVTPVNGDEKADEKAKNDNNDSIPVTRKMQIPKRLRSSLNPVESVTIEYANEEAKNSAFRKLGKKAKAQISKKRKLEKLEKLEQLEKLEELEKLINAGKATIAQREQNKLNKPAPKTEEKLIKPVGNKLKVTKTGTSAWNVETLAVESSERTPKKPLDIDVLFESMEDKLISQIDAKLESVKRKLATNKAASKKLNKQSDKDSDEEYSPDLSFKKRKLRPDLDEEMDETTGGISGNQAIRRTETIAETLAIANGITIKKPTVKSSTEIDPTDFIRVKPKYLNSQIPDIVTGGDEALDDSEGENEQHNIISEAFADDDVVDEFRKEKQDEVKKSQPEDIDLRLPGWGSWGGKDIAPSTRKQRRFIMKFPKDAPRRDENKGDVVIIEEKDPKVKAHQVSDLPYPFNSVKDFEASIRAPIGRTFVPENAHRRFIQPAVKTKMGEIIEPMDTDVLLQKNLKPKTRTPKNLKKKKAEEKINI